MDDHSMHHGAMHNTPAPSVASVTTMSGHMGHNMAMDDGGTGSPSSLHNTNMDMMKMYFHTGVEETVLFHCWHITTIGGMVGSCIGIFFMALMYEGLKVFREYLLRKYHVHSRFSYTVPQDCNGAMAQNSSTVILETHNMARHRFCTWPHFLQTALHVVQVVVSYFLMLIFMTYNIWLCLAVVLGAGAGYLAFGWRKTIIYDVNEHCH